MYRLKLWQEEFDGFSAEIDNHGAKNLGLKRADCSASRLRGFEPGGAGVHEHLAFFWLVLVLAQLLALERTVLYFLQGVFRVRAGCVLKVISALADEWRSVNIARR
jgi:hypothetical protein